MSISRKPYCNAKEKINSEEFMTAISNNIIMNLNNKLEKVDDTKIPIPNINTFKLLCYYNYNINQLKTIAKIHKLKVSGTKPILLTRIYNYLYLSFKAIIIQKHIRGHLRRKYDSYHGPAYYKRKLCTNEYDFLSMEDMKEIPNEQFFSYKDDDGLIYGFDLLSLYNLIYKENGLVKNPFTTKAISAKVIEELRNLLRLSNVLKIDIQTKLKNDIENVSDKKAVELRALTLFQNINDLGNYSDSQWFLDLDRNNLIKFLRELLDIWTYRAPLTVETKREICPPVGNPFSSIVRIHNLQTAENIDDIRKPILTCLEKMATTGINTDSKCLGAYYILCALTLVSHSAATALPWLYEAVAYV